MQKKLPEWDGKKICIRPSAVDQFCNCPRQWYHQHLAGINTVPGARAAMGTALHAAVEHEWTKAIASGKKDFNVNEMCDVAVAEFQELNQDYLYYDNGEDQTSAESSIIGGCAAYAEDIAVFADIPKAVEKRYSLSVIHPVVTEVGGTVDYISKNSIADIKTSRRKPVPASYKTQQSIYRLLAEANGEKVEFTYIQGVVFKAKPEGHILSLESNVEQARYLVNNMLDTLEIFYKDKIDPNVLFRGNPKYYLCDKKYCAIYDSCPYVKGEV